MTKFGTGYIINTVAAFRPGILFISNTIPDRVFIIFESTGEGGRGGYKLGYKLGSRRTKFWNEIRK